MGFAYESYQKKIHLKNIYRPKGCKIGPKIARQNAIDRFCFNSGFHWMPRLVPMTLQLVVTHSRHSEDPARVSLGTCDAAS